MKPKVAIYDFASCEGCELQIVNSEENVLNIVDEVDIVSFREAMKETSEEYDIAFVEGSIQRPIDEERLKRIRSKAKILVALGDCATTGCVNKLRNASPLNESLEEVYSDSSLAKNTLFNLRKSRALNEVVLVDFYIRGCPVRKEQILYYIKRLSWMPLHTPMDCRFEVTEKTIPIDDRSLVFYNPHKCILCRRCDVICREALGVDALGMVGKGPEIVVGTPKNKGFDNNGCIKCGQCVSSCSCGSLETKSCIPQLMKDLTKNDRMKIAVDSIVLASYVEKNLFLRETEPSFTEKHLLGALKEAGFDEIVQYDHYLSESVEKDTKDRKTGSKKMLSWCKGAFNYIEGRIPDAKLERSDKNAPWNLLLNENQNEPLCLLSPCIALKGVRGFKHVLSVMELDELLKQMEIEPEFAKTMNYDGSTKASTSHPGFSSVKLSEGTSVTSLRISKNLIDQIEKANTAFVDIFPCLARCLSGGGIYPTVDTNVVNNRSKWLKSLWGQILE